MLRLSIILPMYKVGPYVERCIRSLENQDISREEYEVICVNDGSPDNCKEVVQKLQNEFDNIVLIDQQNQGVSRARNNGMNKARGKYLLFIDPDDYVDINSFSQVLQNAEQQDINVSFLGYTILDGNGEVTNKVFTDNYANTLYKGEEAYAITRRKGVPDPDRLWAVLFLREFMDRNNLRFIPDVPYLEDGEFLVRILYLAERCIFEKGSFLQRTTRPGSATHSNLFNSDRALKGFLLAAKSLQDFQIEHKSLKKNVNFINQPIVKFVVLTVSSITTVSRFSKIFLINKLLKENNLKHLDLTGCNELYKKLGTLYNKSISILYMHLLLKSFATVLKLRIEQLKRA